MDPGDVALQPTKPLTLSLSLTKCTPTTQRLLSFQDSFWSISLVILLLFFWGGGGAAHHVIYMGSLPLLSQFIDEVPGKCLAFRLYLSLT
jgi:hypothetical protein